jgi:diaminopimelate decarboxylase
VHYAIKANPFPPLLKPRSRLWSTGSTSPPGEMERALDVMAADAISFAGPGKRDAEIEAAIRAGATLNVESEGEADRALAIAGGWG